ncbi:MAG: DJ-1/PfpI family protein [Epulopiscium sp.]|nr:DJ-1/PfpI family protein [Candidatus Epulonipiscium sp.]
MKVIVFLADGFEEVEALTVVDYLRRTNDIEVDTVSIGDGLQVLGAHNIEVKADKNIREVEDIAIYDAAVIPGGMPGSTNLRDNKNVIRIIKEMDDMDKLVAAICAAPIVLEEAGIINGKKVTSYPGFEESLPNSVYKEDAVVVDSNIITARSAAKAVDFTIEIIRYLLGEKEVVSLKKSILYS